jgi:lysophospholipid acyltransferase (LPLAT)-like uncharacterized protein
MKFSPRIISFLGWLFVLLVGKTLRIETEGDGHLPAQRRKGERFIYAFWHGRMFLPLYYHRGQRVYVLVSSHRDGEYVARILHHLGMKTIRGSSARGGARALLTIVRQLRENLVDGAFTPDGPRGPIYQAQSGVIRLAQKTQLPIIPLSAQAASKKVYRKNWSKFILPYPFSRGIIIYGDPIRVPLKSSPEEIQKKTRDLEEVLNRLTEATDRYFQRS